MLLAWWHKTLTGPPPSATAVVGWWLQVEDLPRSRRRPSKHDRAPRKPGDPTKEFRRPRQLRFGWEIAGEALRLSRLL